MTDKWYKKSCTFHFPGSLIRTVPVLRLRLYPGYLRCVLFTTGTVGTGTRTDDAQRRVPYVLQYLVPFPSLRSGSFADEHTEHRPAKTREEREEGEAKEVEVTRSRENDTLFRDPELESRDQKLTPIIL